MEVWVHSLEIYGLRDENEKVVAYAYHVLSFKFQWANKSGVEIPECFTDRQIHNASSVRKKPCTTLPACTCSLQRYQNFEKFPANLVVLQNNAQQTSIRYMITYF